MNCAAGICAIVMMGMSPATNPRIVEEALEATPDAIAVEPLARMLEMVTLLAPSFSIRGGTREIMRSIIARDLGLR